MWIERVITLSDSGYNIILLEALHGRSMGGLGSVVAVRIECDAAQPQDEHFKLDTRVERSAHASPQRGWLVHRDAW